MALFDLAISLRIERRFMSRAGYTVAVSGEDMSALRSSQAELHAGQRLYRYYRHSRPVSSGWESTHKCARSFSLQIRVGNNCRKGRLAELEITPRGVPPLVAQVNQLRF